MNTGELFITVKAQTQGAQRECGISPLGDISNPSGHGPALGGLTWTMVLDRVISKGPFQPQLLLFHEKVKLLQKLCLRWENHSKIGWRLTEGTCLVFNSSDSGIHEPPPLSYTSSSLFLTPTPSTCPLKLFSRSVECYFVFASGIRYICCQHILHTVQRQDMQSIYTPSIAAPGKYPSGSLLCD